MSRPQLKGAIRRTTSLLRGADALHAGFATHFVPSAALPGLVAALEAADLRGGRASVSRGARARACTQ